MMKGEKFVSEKQKETTPSLMRTGLSYVINWSLFYL